MVYHLLNYLGGTNEKIVITLMLAALLFSQISFEGLAETQQYK
ncbi:hypothetical protein ACO1GT_09345 [Staphylococcus arlettae]|nr:hypothetical protein N039_11235 [Staphylococcus sp. EGD-HP3]